MPSVHATAVVAAGAHLADGVTIGPYAVIGSHVRLEDGVRIHAHAVVDGHTVVGPDSEIYPFAAVGLRPQDRKYDGSDTRLTIGRASVVREYVTIQPGSREGGLTRIGHRTLIMAYSHIAHDCWIGDRVTIANAAQIAGHCRIEDHAVLGGVTTVHQFVRVGRHAMTGAATRTVRDVPPFMLVDGNPARVVGLNKVGLERAGYDRAGVDRLKRAFRCLYGSPTLQRGLETLTADARTPEERALVEFVASSTRGITRPRRRVRPPVPRTS